MPIRSVTLRILGESRSARAEMDWVNREADKLNKKKVTVDIEANTPQAKLAALRTQLEGFKNMHNNIHIDVDDKASQLALARINQSLLRIDRWTAKPKISTAALARAQTEAAATSIAFDKLIRGVESFGKEAEVQSNRVGKLFTGGKGFGAFGAFFGGKFALFGGLATIGTLHLLVDAIAEVLAVWIPATVAATAFGIAASDAAREVFTHMQSLHTVMDATGKVIPPMTGNMEKLHEAVRPAVYQIFGDALTVMNAKTGIFQKLALGTAGVVTHLAARMTVAVNSTHGFGEFLKNAVPDLAALGDAFGNLFGIIGNLIHVMPGYAQILLAFGDGFLKVAEWVTKAAEPILGLGLAVHGFIVWAGLGASAAFFLGKAIVALGATTFGAAIKTFGIFIADLITITLTEGLATGATFAFSGALAALGAVNPLIWVGAAVAGLAALVFWMVKSKSSTQQWGDALQKNIDNASSVSQGLNLTQSAVLMTTSKLAQAQLKLANTQKYQTDVNLHTGATTKVLTQAYQQQQGVVDGLTAQQRRFSQEEQFNEGRLKGLSKAYGSQGNAMALLNAAGVTQQEWQTKGAEGWAIITQKINGTLAGYKAMGQTQGTLSNDLQVMDRGITDQYQAMQKLNSAWDQFIGDVTGSQNAFDTSALGLKTLAANFAKVGKNAGDTTHHLGEIKVAGSLAHAAIDGLSQGSLALNQAFTQQVTNTNALIDTWRTAGVSNNLFTRGVKDSIAPLTRYARGSKEATGQLVALAQEAGYNGPNSMKSLVKWLGNTHDALQTVKHVTNQATEQEALLTGSMRAQGNFIANTLIGDINKGILGYTNVAKAARDYGRAIAEDGRQSDQARGARQRLINDIISTGKASGDSKKQIAEMIAKVLNIPLRRALEIVMKGDGTFKVNGGFSSGGSGVGGVGGGHHLATGGRVPGYGGGDIFPAMLEPGEVVVPKTMVRLGAVDHLRGKLPGFADGGLVQTGDLQVLSGQRAVIDYNQFGNTFQSAMVKSMQEAMKKAIQAAFASRVPNVGAGVARWRGLVDRALAMEGLSQSFDGRVLYQMQTESGGNPNAINLTDSNAAAGDPSRGLLQTIMSTFRSYHWPGTSWNIYDPLANIAAAINYARHQYGPTLMRGGMGMGSGHGYAEGTPGAVPGWAMVGERGPELVKMKGGEQVLDAGTTQFVTRGYAKGTQHEETLRGISLIKEFTRDTSTKKLWADMHHFLKVIADYYNGPHQKERSDLVKRQVRAMISIDNRLHNVRANIANEKAYQSKTFANLSQTGLLSGLTLGPTAGIGDNVALSGGQGIKMQLNTKLANLKAFAAALKKLHNMKLKNNLFRQIVDMGPDQGLPYAQELISGGPGFIKQLNGLETSLTKEERSISQGAASSVFAGKYLTGADYYKNLKNQKKDLEQEFRHLGRILGTEAGKWFGVPKGRRHPKGFATGGILREPVWGFGISGQEYSFGEEGAEFFAPMKTPHHSGSYSGGDTYNITVNGDTDPDGAAMRIIQKVRDYKRHHGNQPTGIG